MPSPLDTPHPLRVDTESDNLVDACRNAHVRVTLGGIVPSTVENIRIACTRWKPAILHVAAHSGPDGLELEDRQGTAVSVSIDTLISTLSGLPVPLVVLNGCATEGVALKLRRALGSFVVGTQGYIADEVASTFTSAFYKLLLSTGDLSGSFEACKRVLIEQYGTGVYHLYTGDMSLPEFPPGLLSVDTSLLKLRSRSLARTVVGRRDALLELFPLLSTEEPGTILVSGIPGSGVSTFLRMSLAYYGWMFEAGSEYLDCRPMNSNVTPTVNPGGGSVALIDGLSQSLREPRRLVVLDHFDDADTRTMEMISSLLAADQSSPRARVIVGASSVPAMDLAPAAELELRELDRSEALELLRNGLGGDIAERFDWILDAVPRLPGRLAIICSDIDNGAREQDIRRAVELGDPRADLSRVVERIALKRSVRDVLQCQVLTGVRAPRDAILRGYSALNEGPESRWGVSPEFEEAVAILRRSRFMWVEQVQAQGGAIPDSFFCCSPELLRVAETATEPLGPSERDSALDAMLKQAHLRGEDHLLRVDNDISWLLGLVTHADSSLQADTAAHLGFLLLGRHGDFRISGSFASVEPFARACFECAQQAGDLDRGAQLGLVLGEMNYKLGFLSRAEEAFKQVLAMGAPPGRKLQSLRALGQVRYRRGDYAGALLYYRDAEEYLATAPSFAVATLRQERAKALSRLGRHEDAIAELRLVMNLRDSEGDQRAMMRTRHELARVLQKAGRLDEAASLFQLVLGSAVSLGASRETMAPNYQLALLSLERGEISEARRRLSECRESAIDLDDSLWLTLADLGDAMVAFEERRWEESTSLFRRAMESARRQGYRQVIDDGRDWLRSRSLRVIIQENDDNAAGIRGILSTTEGLPLRKVDKALRYSSEPERVAQIQVQMETEHGVRLMVFQKGRWSCSCDLFQIEHTCSHLVALTLMEGNLLWKIRQQETGEASND